MGTGRRGCRCARSRGRSGLIARTGPRVRPDRGPSAAPRGAPGTTRHHIHRPRFSPTIRPASAERLGVVADGGLRLAEGLHQVAGAGLTLGGDDREQAQAHRVGQRGELAGQLLGVGRVQRRPVRAGCSRPGPGSRAWWPSGLLGMRFFASPIDNCRYICEGRYIDNRQSNQRPSNVPSPARPQRVTTSTRQSPSTASSSPPSRPSAARATRTSPSPSRRSSSCSSRTPRPSVA